MDFLAVFSWKIPVSIWWLNHNHVSLKRTAHFDNNSSLSASKRREEPPLHFLNVGNKCIHFSVYYSVTAQDLLLRPRLWLMTTCCKLALAHACLVLTMYQSSVHLPQGERVTCTRWEGGTWDEGLGMGVGKTSTHLQCGTQAKRSPCKQQTGPCGRVVGQGLCE